MKIKIYSVLFLIIFSITSNISNAQSSPEELYRKGLEAFLQTDFDKSIKYLDEYIASAPNDVLGYHYRGLTYLALRMYSKALENFSSIIALAPRNVDALVNRGNVYIIEGNTQAAVKDFTDALFVEPYSIDAYIGRSRAFMEKGEFAKATSDLDAAVNIDPENSRLYIVRTYLSVLSNDTAKIFENAGKAILYDSVSIFTDHNRDQLYFKVATYSKILGDMNDLLIRHPESYLGYFNRGFVYFLMNNFENASQDFSRALALTNSENKEFRMVTRRLLYLIERNEP